MKNALLLTVAAALVAAFFMVEAAGADEEYEGGDTYATGVGVGDADARANAYSGSYSSSGANSYSGAYQSQGQGQSQGQSSYNRNSQYTSARTGSQFVGQGQHAATGSQDVLVEGSDDDTYVLTVNPTALAAMPAAVCQGASRTASAGGGAPTVGFALGFGSADVDSQCTLRENIKLVAAMWRMNPALLERLMGAIAQLEGFEVAAEVPAGAPVSLRPAAEVAPLMPGSVEYSEQD